VAEAGQSYAEDFRAYLAAAPRLEPVPATSDLDVDRLLLQMLSAREKIARLARLVGTLQYAVEGSDQQLAAETVSDMQSLGQLLEEKYWAAELIATAQGRGDGEKRLTQLYIERCYRLADEDYAALAELDSQISALRSELGQRPAET
jgi:hypothetical protein